MSGGWSTAHRTGRGGGKRKGSWSLRAALGAFVAFTLVSLCLVAFSNSNAASTGSAGSVPAAPTVPAFTSEQLAPSTGTSTGELNLGITSEPTAVCVDGLSSCAAGTGTSRVTLTAAPTPAAESWPAVQVAFILETTNYDGAGCYTGCGPDICDTSDTGDGMCEEANGPQFLMVNAERIADAIQSSNPHTQVSFALIDGFATHDYLDDGDDPAFHVDTANFIPVQDFGQVALQVKANLFHCDDGWTYCDSGMADSFLHSDMITELYGTIQGFGLDWSPDTHHVIVVMTSSAPRAPGFSEDYGASYSYCGSQTEASLFSPGCQSPTCEPAYSFGSGQVSPNCEGWTTSQDGNSNDSIAALAKTSPECVDAVGGTCTIDVIDLWTTPTDPTSPGWWPNHLPEGGGATAQEIIQTNVNRVLLAGCDIAAATGGSWDGPAWFACPDGQQGTMQFVPHGSLIDPNTNNPTLFDAITHISFGPVLNTEIAKGLPGQPIFTFVPAGNIALAAGSSLDLVTTCDQNGAPFLACAPGEIYQKDGINYLGWNWSRYPNNNSINLGDVWSASFNVYAAGPPEGPVPVDACTTIYCIAGGSSPVDNLYTWAAYLPYTNISAVVESFPLAQINVEPVPTATPPGTGPPPVGGGAPAFPISAPAPVPVIQQLGVGQSVAATNVSLQATAAGFLGAGFVRVMMRNKPIALQMAMKAGPMHSKFEGAAAEGPSVGRFE